MREGWSRTTIGAAADVVGGGTPRTSEPSYWGGPIPWITPTEVVAAEGAAITTTTRTLTELGLQKSGARLLPEASILVTSRATVGAVAMAGCQMATNQGFAALIAGPLLVPKFLMLWSQANAGEFRMRAGGSTFPEISRSVVREIPIDIPPLDEQRRIVDIIGSLDATIAATDQAVAKAEQARRAVLTDLLSLTPSSAQSAIADASKRPPIARGWSRVTIGQVADAQRGYSYSSPELSAEPTGFGLVALKTVGKNGGFQRQGMRFLRSAERSPATVGPGDLLVAATDLTRAREVLGSSILVPQGLPPESVFSLDMVKLVPNPQVVMTEFLDCFLQAPHTRRVVKSLGTGTTVVHLNVAAFLALPVLLPPLDEQRRIVDMVSTLHNEVVALKATAKAARSARAGILSELLSGSHEIPASYDRLLEAT